MIWILCIFTLFLSSCQDKPQERQYTETVVEAPEFNRPMSEDPHAGLNMPSMATQDLEVPTMMNLKYSWVAPQGWTQEPGQGMRLASFYLSENKQAIDCSVISLAGIAGGLEANLQRWMGQIGLESSSADFTSLISSATIIKTKGGLEGKVFDFTNIQPQAQTEDKSMIVVMVVIDDETLFVKMTGTIETVRKNKKDFFDLVQSIEQHDGTAEK